MKYRIYKITYNTFFRSPKTAIMSAKSRKQSVNLLEKCFLEEYNKITSKAKIKKTDDVDFKITEQIFTGFESNKEGVINFEGWF